MNAKTIIVAVAAAGMSLSAAAQWNPGPQSRVESHTIHSAVLDAERAYTIFLPLSYDVAPQRSYPVLYLLHGMGDTNIGWYERGHVKDVMDQLVASGEAAEMIIVTPNAGGNIYEGAWNGYFDMPGWKYETFFFTEFVPHIESTYRVIGDRAHRAVAGLSMGGGGATSYGQRHADVFSAVYAMSALMDINGSNQMPGQDPDSKMAHLTRAVQENSCVRRVTEADDARREQLRSVKWFIDCGDDDFLLDVNLDLNRAMRQARIPFEFRMRDGGHTWEYWHSALYTCLGWMSRNFANNSNK